MADSDMVNLGKVMIVPKGPFVLGTQYYRLDYVTDGGSSYLAKLDSKDVPLSDSNSWMKITDYSDLYSLIGAVQPTWEAGGMYVGTGIEYPSSTQNPVIRTTFIPVTPGDFYLFNWTPEQVLNVLGFVSNTKTETGVNQRTAYKATPYANQPFGYVIPDGVYYIRLQITGTMADEKPTVICITKSDMLKGAFCLGSAETITDSNKHHYFTDANDAPVNKAYNVRASAEIANTPYGNGMSSASVEYTGGVREITGYLSGILYTFRAGEMTNQIFISSSRTVSGNSEPSTLYYRSKYSGSGWSYWHKLNDKAQLTASNIAIRKKMIAPYLDGDTPTATNTNVSNPQYMGDDPLIFSDFNDAPLQSIYQIDLDCDATVMANNPMPGKSSVLVTMGFSYVSQHGKIQLCVGLDYPNAFAYVRYGYQNTSTQYIWTPWSNITGYSELVNTIRDNGLALPIIDGWITGKRMGTPAVGETFTDAPGSISTWQYIKLACSPGDTFTINAVGTSTFLPWAFADADLKCLNKASNATAANGVITAPENAAWLYINQNADRGVCYQGNLVVNRLDNIENTGYANKGRLENGTDLNTVTTSGVYLLGTNGGYVNAPSGLTYGFLTVKTVNTITLQTVESPAGNFARFYNSSSWGNWATR